MNKILLAAAALLSGICGFYPKGIGGISRPFPYQAWHIANGQATQQALNKALRYADGKLVGADRAQVVLTAGRIDTHRNIYTITRATKINEYLPILRTETQASVNGGPLGEPIVVVVNRKTDYASSDVLGKAEEEQTIWSEMRTDTTEQIVYRLTFLKALQQMASADIEQLSPDSPLKSLYVIHSEENLLRMEALDTLRAATKRQGYLNREVCAVDNAFDRSELLQSAGSAGLSADLKLLETHTLNDEPGKNSDETLQSLAECLPEDTVTVAMLSELEKARTQAKWLGALAVKDIILEAKAIGTAALPQWMGGHLREFGPGVESSALTLFAERVEDSLLAVKQEIDKLALLHPQGYTVSVADIKAAVANVVHLDVSQLVGAWMKGDDLRVARLLEGLKESDEEPVLLLWAVVEDIHTLIRLAAVLKQG